MMLIESGDNLESGIYTGIYKGKEVLGFKADHTYVFDLKHNNRFYTLHAFSDVTYEDEIEEVDIFINYSSYISINQNWTIVNNDQDDD